MVGSLYFFFSPFQNSYCQWIPVVYDSFETIGTERCNEALQKLEKTYDIVVNIQGDEPLVEPEIIDGVVQALQVKNLSLQLMAQTVLPPQKQRNCVSLF